MPNLLSIDDLGADGIRDILDLTDSFAEVSARAIPKVPALRGKTVASVFYENSTRTRLSFETAAKRLSADTMNFSVSTSSVSKGESLRDTMLTVEALGADVLVVRHAGAGVPWQVASWVDASVVNAGDGQHEHPTQALLDCYTIRRAGRSFEGLRVGIIGDIRHSRVARSNVRAFSALGASVVLVAPTTLLPVSTAGWNVEVSDDLDDVVGGLDVVYLLRMQRERQDQALVPSLREYHDRFGLTDRRLAALRDDALVMHPGPMNRGVEISDTAANRAQETITDQVANGVAVRMAVLFWILGSGVDLSDAPGLPAEAERRVEGALA